MKRTKAIIALGVILFGLPHARADSDAPTTISAEGDALSRSTTAASLSTVMPTAPPPYSDAGAPAVHPSAPPIAAPSSALAPAPGGALQVDPKARGNNIAPIGVVAPVPAAATLVAPPVAPPGSPSVSVDSVRENPPRRRKSWRLILGAGAGALALAGAFFCRS